MKFYHASRNIILPGDVVTPKSDPPLDNKRVGLVVFLNDKPECHWTLWQYGKKSFPKKRYNIYEVVPQGKVKFSNEFDEFYTKRSCIIKRCLGEAPKRNGGMI